MRKTVWALFGCLAGLLTGIVYFFGTTIVYDLAEYAVEMLLLAVVGFVLFGIVNCVVFWLTKKKSMQFALGFIVSAFVIDIAVLITLGGIRYYPPETLPPAATTVSTTANSLDAEYYYAASSHLYTFSFNGQAFTPNEDFMIVHTLVSDLDGSVYFKVDDLCAYAQELTELSDEQLDQIKTSDKTKGISGNPYIRLIDLSGYGIYTFVGWEFSSHTPVHFTTDEPDVTTIVSDES
jgi:hypothetical protein